MKSSTLTNKLFPEGFHSRGIACFDTTGMNIATNGNNDRGIPREINMQSYHHHNNNYNDTGQQSFAESSSPSDSNSLSSDQSGLITLAKALEYSTEGPLYPQCLFTHS